MASSSPPGRLKALVQAAPVAAALGVMSLLVHSLGLQRSAIIVWRLADRLPPPRPNRLEPRPLAEAQARAIGRIADRMPFDARCLPRALLLAGSLRRRGIAADLCLGTRTVGEFDAHAWVEIDGQPVNEPAGLDATYNCLWRRATNSG